jgi:hypothetical protein
VFLKHIAFHSIDFVRVLPASTPLVVKRQQQFSLKFTLQKPPVKVHSEEEKQ